MKRVLAVILVLSFAALALALGSVPQPPSSTGGSAAYPFLIDNFEDGTYAEAPVWFVFDNLVPTVARNAKYQDGDSQVVKNIGEYSLNLKGSTSSWYVGGIGTILGVDASQYKSFEIDIYGFGENSGKLKVEMYDDDNGNSDIEVDSAWKPTADDLFLAEVEVNWTGWKHVSLPISQLKIEGNGNKVWDPSLAGGSGGLVKLQLIGVAFTETGDVNYNIDNLELGK